MTFIPSFVKLVQLLLATESRSGQVHECPQNGRKERVLWSLRTLDRTQVPGLAHAEHRARPGAMDQSADECLVTRYVTEVQGAWSVCSRELTRVLNEVLCTDRARKHAYVILAHHV
jgi:hypothetical protein